MISTSQKTSSEMTENSGPLLLAKRLSLFTIFYNIAEGVISIYFGIEEESISLLGFGLDSFIEVASATIVLLKLRSLNPDSNLSNERRATFAIGILFLILSLNVFLQSGIHLMNGASPDTTIPGVVVSVVSLSFMFFLWTKKKAVAQILNSSTIMADAKCSLACIKLSFVLLLGSFLFWLVPTLWWVDSVAAVIIGFFILKEGWEMISSSRKEEFKGGCGCH